jgi:hypothetical protein
MIYSITSSWTDLNTLTGVSIGVGLYVQNIGFAGDVLEVIISETEPEPGSDDRGFCVYQMTPGYRIRAAQTAWVRFIRYDRNDLDVGQRELKIFASSDFQLTESYIDPALYDASIQYDALNFRSLIGTNLTISQASNMEGNVYRAFIYETFTSNQVRSWQLQMPAVESGRIIAFEGRIFKSYESDAFLNEYISNTDVVLLGTTVDIQKENRRSPTDATLLIEEVDTFTPGTLIDTDFIGVAGNVTQRSGGISAEAGFQVFAEGEAPIVEITNGSDEQLILIQWQWIELPSIYFTY